MNFDLIAGIDNSTLNSLIGQCYNLIYPNVLKGNMPVNKFGIESIAFDVNMPPTVGLSSQGEGRTFFKNLIENAQEAWITKLNNEDKVEMLQYIAAATLSLNIPSIQLTINYSNNAPSTQFNASLSLAANIQTSIINGENNILIEILSGTVNIPTDPAIQDLFNDALIPYFIPNLNQTILKPIPLPPLSYDKITVSPPLPVVQQPYFLICAALGTTSPSEPAPQQWPENCIFVGVDTAVIEAACAQLFPLGPEGNFSWEIIHGTAQAVIQTPTAFVFNSDGSISAQLTANALAQLTIDFSFGPKFTFGPSATAQISASLKPSVQDNKVAIVIEGCTIPALSFSWGSIPSWVSVILTPLLDGLAAALNLLFGSLINKALSSFSIPVYTIENINLPSAGGKSLQLSFSQATTSTENGLLVVSIQPAISAN